MKVRIREIEACCPHPRVDTRSDGTIGFHFEMGYQEKRIQDRKIYNWSRTSSFLGIQEKTGVKTWRLKKDPEPSVLLLSRSKTELHPTEASASLCLTCETKRWESLTVELTSETEDLIDRGFL